MPAEPIEPRWLAGSVPRRPAVPLAVAFLTGISLYNLLPVLPWLWLLLIAVEVLLAVLFRRHGLLASLVLLLGVFLAGAAVAQVESYFHPRDDISAYASDEPHLAQLVLTIDDEPRLLTGNFNLFRALPPKQVCIGRVNSVLTWDGWRDSAGAVLVQIDQPHPRLAINQQVRVLCVLNRPAPAMNPGQFDWASYYREQRVLASVHVAHAGNVQILSDPGPGPIDRLRAWVRRNLALGFEPRDSLDHALLAALLLGDRDPQLRDVQDQFARTGTSHHLAISGMHVAVLGGAILLLCRLLRLSPRVSSIVALVLVVVYGVVALPSPPVIRSVVLCACVALGILSARNTDALQLLCISVIAMLVYHPLDLFNAGFQLSFGTVLGLILFTRPVMEWLNPRDPFMDALGTQRTDVAARWLRRVAATTLSAGVVAWVVSAPLIAYHFEQLNPWAIPASIALAPVVLTALVGGFAKVVLTLVFPSGAGTWAGLSAQPIALMRWMVDGLASLPGGDVPIPAPPIVVLILFYGFMLLALRVKWVGRLVRTLAFAGIAFLLILPFVEGFARIRKPTGLDLTLLAVGAGQCVVIQPPGEDAWVIDAGSRTLMDPFRKAIAPFIRHEGRRNVHAVVLTHSDYDHISAAFEMVQAYDVSQVLTSPLFAKFSVDNPPAEGLLEKLGAMDKAPTLVRRGDRILIGEATLDCLWPPADCDLPDSNDTGLVLKLTYHGRSILMPADIQDPAMRELLKQPEELRADVLVAPHHGSVEELTDEFVRAVTPAHIISSNSWKLSGKQKRFDDTIDLAPIYRTSDCGAITVHMNSDGTIRVDGFVRLEDSRR